MFVVHTGVHHGDDHTFTADAQIPGTLRIDRRGTGLDRRRLHVTPEHKVAIGFHHDHIVQTAQGRNQAGINLAQQNGVHGGHHQLDREAELFHGRNVTFPHVRAVGETNPDRTEGSVKGIVDAVLVEVQGGTLPPWSHLFYQGAGSHVGQHQRLSFEEHLPLLSFDGDALDRRKTTGQRNQQERDESNGQHARCCHASRTWLTCMKMTSESMLRRGAS